MKRALGTLIILVAAAMLARRARRADDGTVADLCRKSTPEGQRLRRPGGSNSARMREPGDTCIFAPRRAVE